MNNSTELLATKDTCDLYSLNIPEESKYQCLWAKVIIDNKDWILSCVSDAGNFSYRWPSERHRTFKKFLTGIDKGYLMRKIEPRASEFNYEETLKELKRTILDMRRQDSISKKQAKEEYEILENIEFESSPDLVMYQLIEKSNIFGNDYSWTAEIMVYDHSPGAVTFTQVVFPLLQKVLKAEIGC